MWGMEEEVLKGAELFLQKNLSPIILEYQNKSHIKFTGKDMRGVLKILRGFKYDLFALNRNGVLEDFDETNSYENIIAIKKNNQELKKLLI